MIARLRRRHARMVTALAVLAPAVVIAAVVARQPPASQAVLPSPLEREMVKVYPSKPFPLHESALTWPGLKLHTKIWLHDERRYLELSPHEPLRSPDVLLYASEQPAGAKALPNDARLVGRFAGSRAQTFELPAELPASLWLFSLAHGEVLGSADLGSIHR